MILLKPWMEMMKVIQIMIESKEESTSSDENTTLIPSQLKGKFLDDAIASYKAKC